MHINANHRPRTGEESDDDSGSEVDPAQIKADHAAASLLAQRKKAGIPELALDALPSTIATKMLRLDVESFLIFPFLCLKRYMPFMELGWLNTDW